VVVSFIGGGNRSKGFPGTDKGFPETDKGYSRNWGEGVYTYSTNTLVLTVVSSVPGITFPGKPLSVPGITFISSCNNLYQFLE
jgi:hypothetical protein